MDYKKQPLHIQADADYFACELENPESFNINVEERINEIDDLDYAKLIIEALLTKKTSIKFINEIDVDVTTEEDDESQIMSYTIYECNQCHWRFVGDSVRYGYGYDSEGVQTPNFCPMCGKKIIDEIEE